jgi:lipopolysaccharide transport system ATP-binding protein
MSEAIISVEGLGKKYRIQHQAERQRYVALRDVIAEKAKGLFKKLKSGNNVSVSASQNVSVSLTEDFWALKDVSFEVKRGEVVGIIGRNGAGKSTLLKILSRITELSEGRVQIKGRVTSLLEVGTGFHPELTGRENIFLNGAILGMHRAEIKTKFDEIVAFAEVEKFLDTPVKRYSSGMYVRLAFAVAAHLEPEILIVDEVLAVGDADFQKKCLGKMESVSQKEGRTVLFVSHQMAAVQRLCTRGVLFAEGALVCIGSAELAVGEYLARLEHKSETELLSGRIDREGSGRVRFEEVRMLRLNAGNGSSVCSGDNLQIRIKYSTPGGRDIPNVMFHVAFDSPVFGRVFMCQSNLVGLNLTARSAGGEVALTLDRLPLAAGVYTANLWGAVEGMQGELLDFVRQAFCLRVEVGDFFQTGQVPTGGVFLVPQTWSHL